MGTIAAMTISNRAFFVNAATEVADVSLAHDDDLVEECNQEHGTSYHVAKSERNAAAHAAAFLTVPQCHSLYDLCRLAA